MKILIIGQAPGFQKQNVPYDTTMLYTWLDECGISKESAQDIFDFEAVSNVFPGFDANGGHLKPSLDAMLRHWQTTLEGKVIRSDKIILLGNAAKEFFYSQPKSRNLNILELPHPSKRNYALYQKNKVKILTSLKEFML